MVSSRSVYSKLNTPLTASQAGIPHYEKEGVTVALQHYNIFVSGAARWALGSHFYSEHCGLGGGGWLADDIGGKDCYETAHAHSGNPAFRRPSINSFAFDSPPRAIYADIVKAGLISSTRAAASCASASRPRWAKADARQR